VGFSGPAQVGLTLPSAVLTGAVILVALSMLFVPVTEFSSDGPSVRDDARASGGIAPPLHRTQSTRD